jgi:hypothetical protein
MNHALSHTGLFKAVTWIIAEQVHPFTNEPLSVSPLAWSHAEFVALVYAYEKRRSELVSACPTSFHRFSCIDSGKIGRNPLYFVTFGCIWGLYKVIDVLDKCGSIHIVGGTQP